MRWMWGVQGFVCGLVILGSWPRDRPPRLLVSLARHTQTVFTHRYCSLVDIRDAIPLSFPLFLSFLFYCARSVRQVIRVAGCVADRHLSAFIGHHQLRWDPDNLVRCVDSRCDPTVNRTLCVCGIADRWEWRTSGLTNASTTSSLRLLMLHSAETAPRAAGGSLENPPHSLPATPQVRPDEALGLAKMRCALWLRRPPSSFPPRTPHRGRLYLADLRHTTCVVCIHQATDQQGSTCVLCPSPTMSCLRSACQTRVAGQPFTPHSSKGRR